MSLRGFIGQQSDTDQKVRIVKKGEFNHFVGVLGRPGTGKSVHATMLAMELAKTPAYVIAHDNGWRLPVALPDGTPTRIWRHETMGAAQKALSETPAGIHSVATTDAEPLIELAKTIAGRSLQKHGGTHGVPVVLLIDEVVGAGVCDPNRISASMRDLIAKRRHYNVGVIWTCQSARLVHNQLLSLASELRIFKLTDRRDHARLDEAGVEPEVIQQVANLEKYHHAEVAFS